MKLYFNLLIKNDFVILYMNETINTTLNITSFICNEALLTQQLSI